MYMISFFMTANAVKSASRKPYLALLREGPRGQGVDREFVKRKKSGKNRYFWRANIIPGDVVEIRRSCWDPDRNQFSTRTIWAGVEQNGKLLMLSRDEAIASIESRSSGLPPAPVNGLPGSAVPERMIPEWIFFGELPREAEDSGQMIEAPNDSLVMIPRLGEKS